MKNIKLIAVVVLLALLTCSFSAAEAGQAELKWQAPTTNEDGTPLTDLSGYKLYYSKTQGVYANPVTLGNVTTYTIPLSNGKWYFVVTAYNTQGSESAYSNEVSKIVNVAPAKPTGCEVK